jgi:hypothetical protein
LKAADPISEFFMIKRGVVDTAARHLSTQGFKLLFVIVKSTNDLLSVRFVCLAAVGLIGIAVHLVPLSFALQTLSLSFACGKTNATVLRSPAILFCTTHLPTAASGGPDGHLSPDCCASI